MKVNYKAAAATVLLLAFIGALLSAPVSAQLWALSDTLVGCLTAGVYLSLVWTVDLDE